MPAFRNYHVTSAAVDQTLSAALRQFLAGLSWSKIKTLIASRRVQVNGNLCLDETRRLQAGDVVKVWEQPLAKPADASDVRIVYCDEHLVVVHKPAGITTLRHPEERSWPARRKQLQPTLDELVPQALAKTLGLRIEPATEQDRRRGPARRSSRGRKQNERSPYPVVRAVHRLDRDTSGLMVFARTSSAETELIRLFSKHKIERAYLAVVQGQIAEQTLDTYLVRDRGDGLRGSTPLGEKAERAQRAITRVRPLEQFGDYSVIECRLETGRTHQIRIHLAEIGHMLCGEKTYINLPGQPPSSDDSGAPRQALHAAELGFVHPITGQPLRFRSTWPRDLAMWLARLKEQAAKNG
jgi:23S rRNA pseudouridine1911/1915/1917 synthase